MATEKIFVTQPVLPSLKDFQVLLEQIWNNKTLTNNDLSTNNLKKNWLII